jgi:PEP phosphonomutase and related enzymes
MYSKPRKLRELFATKGIVVAPGAHNGLSAKIIDRMGFDAIYGTGYGASASYLGRPDIGLMTLTEMVTHMHNMASVTDLPVIADGDTGYGNAVNAMRAVREYEGAGLAAIQFEDQVLPKKCGHMLGRELVSMEEMVGKIKAAISARCNPDFVIIARTDARTQFGIEEAIRRGKAYAKAGADVVFIESPESEEEMRRINAEIPVPTLANMVEKGRTPLLPVKKLEELGYKLAIFPVTSVLAEASALFDVYGTLKERGDTNDIVGTKLYDFEKFNELLGLPEVRRLEQEFAGRVVKG